MALQTHLLELREKIQLLLKQYASAQKTVKQLQNENEKLKQQLAASKAELAEVSARFTAANVSGMPQSADEKQELEKRINAYLKDIDKCLQMLNT